MGGKGERKLEGRKERIRRQKRDRGGGKRKGKREG